MFRPFLAKRISVEMAKKTEITMYIFTGPEKKFFFLILTEFWNPSGLDVEAVDEAGHDCSGKVFLY